MFVKIFVMLCVFRYLPLKVPILYKLLSRYLTKILLEPNRVKLKKTNLIFQTHNYLKSVKCNKKVSGCYITCVHLINILTKLTNEVRILKKNG